MISPELLENFGETLCNKTAIVDVDAPQEFRPGELGAIISLGSTNQEILVEFGDGSDVFVPLHLLSLLEDDQPISKNGHT